MVLMYLRKSRADDSSMTVEEVLAKHEAILQEYHIKNYGKPLDEAFIFREVCSGETISEREQIQKVLQRITTDNVDGVLVVEPQRLSRGDLVDCGTICRVFKYSNTKIITPRRTYDLTDEYDYKFFEMELRQGNEYLEYIKSIMHRGRIAAIKSGQYIGNIAPLGYDRTVIDGKKTLVPNDKSPLIQYIFELAEQGKAPHSIAVELDGRGIKPERSPQWSATSIRHILTNITYTGKVKYGERQTKISVDEKGNTDKKRKKASPIIAEGLHPAIINETTYNNVQNILGKSSREPRNKELKNPFATLVVCGNCGYSVKLMTYHNTCAPRMVCTHQSQCHSQSILYDEFLNSIINALKAKISDFDVKPKNDTADTQNALVSSAQNEILILERRQLKLFDLIEKELITDEEFIKRKQSIEAERDKLEQTLNNKIARVKEKKNAAEYSATLHTVIDSLADNSISPKAKNDLLKGIIDKIVFTAPTGRKTDRKPSEATASVRFKLTT